MRGTHRSVAAVEALVVAELAVGVLISVLVGGTRLDADVVVGEVLAGEAVSWSLKHAAARETISNGETAICWIQLFILKTCLLLTKHVDPTRLLKKLHVTPGFIFTYRVKNLPVHVHVRYN